MNEKELNSKIFSGTIWKFCERIIAQGVSFVVSLILARLLMPEDYGAISVINIFIAIADVFLSSGLNTALIQKKDASELEFNTIFYCNLILGGIVYVVFFIAAPFIAEAYDTPILTTAMRVFALRLPISSFQSIQSAYVSRTMNFKKFFFATTIGTIASAVVGIAMAYQGFGVWALIAQYLTNTIVNTFTLFTIVEWRPKLQFSFSAAKPLISYGWKVMFTDLAGTICNNLGNLLIGYQYTTTDLAYYSRGKQLPLLIRNNLYTTLISVLFPGISNVNDDFDHVKNISRKSIQVLSYVVFPMMVGMCVVAEPLTIVMYTEKWIAIVPYVQIVCVECILSVIGTITLQAIKAIGRSDIMLKMEFIKKPILILSIIIAMRFGVTAIALTLPFNTFIDFIINGIACQRLINYRLTEQVQDCSYALISSIVMGLCVYLVSCFISNIYAELVLEIIVGVVVYVAISLISKNETFCLLTGVLKDKLHIHKN